MRNFVNDRAKGLKPSGIRKFFDIVQEMEDAISLGVGEPDFVTPWYIRDAAVRSIKRGLTQYTGNRGLPELREKAYQYNMPVHIGKNCWLGAGVIVLPGVTIGDNSVIGAGSLVNKDIPPDVVAVGTPCKVLRKINDNDKEFYAKGKRIDWSDIIR